MGDIVKSAPGLISRVNKTVTAQVGSSSVMRQEFDQMDKLIGIRFDTRPAGREDKADSGVKLGGQRTIRVAFVCINHGRRRISRRWQRESADKVAQVWLLGADQTRAQQQNEINEPDAVQPGSPRTGLSSAIYIWSLVSSPFLCAPGRWTSRSLHMASQ